jgi:undecaprenyl diphosphate synthase
MAYGEMYITDKYWPEFRRSDLYNALISFKNRERRFGKTSAQVASEKNIRQNDTYFKRIVDAFKGK